MRRLRSVRLSVLVPALLCAALLGVACDSSITIAIGTLRVEVMTFGNNLDPDGYVVRVTGNGADESRPVEVNGQVLFALDAGRYEVELTEKAGNCATDLNPQVVDVAAGEITVIQFNTLCG